MRTVAYYKGCLAALSAKELDISTQALAPKVGLELIELEAVTCCGAGDIHEAEPDYYLHLNARILAYAEDTGSDTLMTVCNVCTLNLRQANHALKGDAALLERVNQNLVSVGAPAYSGNVDVQHFLWLVAAGDGYELLKNVAHKGLQGLKIAPFYGCQILRPSKLLGFEDPDKPTSLERIIEACGGESIDYPAKIKCCGFPIIQAREDVALAELIQPIEQAKEAGADAMVTPCPLCHLSLDAWQLKLKEQTGKDFQMPVLHLSQLIGVAAGLDGSDLRVQAPHRLRRARRRATVGLDQERGVVSGEELAVARRSLREAPSRAAPAAAQSPVARSVHAISSMPSSRTIPTSYRTSPRASAGFPVRFMSWSYAYGSFTSRASSTRPATRRIRAAGGAFRATSITSTPAARSVATTTSPYIDARSSCCSESSIAINANIAASTPAEMRERRSHIARTQAPSAAKTIRTSETRSRMPLFCHRSKGVSHEPKSVWHVRNPSVVTRCAAVCATSNVKPTAMPARTILASTWLSAAATSPPEQVFARDDTSRPADVLANG